MNDEKQVGNFWWLYLDESGDLGFDFVNSKPSRYFTLCILATSHPETNRRFGYAVKKTLKRKMPGKNELKATNTNLTVKKYVWAMIASDKFGVYTLTLNKLRVYDRLAENRERVYNFISRLVIDKIPFEKARGRIQLIIDRSKGRRQIAEFNTYLARQLSARISPDIPIDFVHADSCQYAGIQLADLFAWGIFRKYERDDTQWYDVYKEKVLLDKQYL
jgi:hypothetical protein